MFDAIPALAAPGQSHLCSELDHYLSTDIEDVQDALQWWNDRCSAYPSLSRMALDYLSIPGMLHGLNGSLVTNSIQ
jgi:hypothetical protein